MAETLNDNIQNNSPKALENKHGKLVSFVWTPYANTTEANSVVNIAYRYRGLTVIVLKSGVATEYWYRDGITDGDLIEKTIGTIGFWALDGNTSIPAGSFLGTRTNDDLVIKRNSIEMMRVGSGEVFFGTNSSTGGVITFYGATSGKVSIQGNSVITDWILSLPPDNGTTGQFLQTDGNGNTVWATPSSTSGGTVTSVSVGNLGPLFTSSVATASTTPAITYSLTNATGGTLFGNNTGSSAAPSYTASPVLGIAGTTLGTIGISGNTSGVITIRPAATAGTWTFTLPTSGGTNNYVLATNGSGTSSWVDVTSLLGGLYTANNGLTMSSNNTVLGGALTGNTSINATSAYTLQVTGAITGSSRVMEIINSSTGTGLYVSSSSMPAIQAAASGVGYGVQGSSGSSYGVIGQSTSGTGIAGTSTSGKAGEFTIAPSSTTTTVPIITVYRGTSGTAATAMGGSILYQLKDASNNIQDAGYIASRWTNAATASRTSAFDVYTVNSGVNTLALTVAGNGNIIIPVLASGGTAPTTSGTNMMLTTDVNGLVSFQAIPSGGGGGGVSSIDVSGGTTGLTTSGGPITSSGTITLAGTLITSNGGTGLTSFTQGDVPYYTSGTALSKLAKSVTANQFISNGGTSNAPAWTTITAAMIGSGAALTKTDDTNVTATLAGNPSIALLAATSLTLGWTGTLAVARGGIGIGTLASNGVLYGNGTSAVQALAVNSSGTTKVLTQASSAAPAWTDPATLAVTSVGLSVPSLLTVTGSPITSTGTFAVTWNGVTAGGLVYGSGINTAANLAAGTNGYLLQMVSGAPAWIDYGSLKSPGNFWNILGNTSIDETIHFIGTTDDHDVVGKRNGLEIFRLKASSFNLTGNSTNPGTLKFYEDTDNGTNFTSLTVGTQAGDIAYTFPTAYPAGNGYALTSTTAGVWSWTALTTGTVTSVALSAPSSLLSVSGSPVTASGTLALALASVAGGTLFGNSSASSTTPSFSINPTIGIAGTSGGSLSFASATSGNVTIQVSGATTSYNFNLPNTVGTAGQVLTSQGGGSTSMTWTTVGTGTVTSVALTVPSILSVSGSPVTTSGTLAMTLANATGGTIFANNTTSATTPAFTAVPVLGVAGTTAGTLGLSGVTSGIVTIKTAVAAGTYNFTLPNSGGTNTYSLITDGSGGTSWANRVYTASNGLTMSSNNAVLGGTLTGITTVNTGAYPLTFQSTSGSTINISDTGFQMSGNYDSTHNVSLSGIGVSGGGQLIYQVLNGTNSVYFSANSNTTDGNYFYFNGGGSGSDGNFGVSIGTASTGIPTPSAILDITSTLRGVLLPRMTTTQQNAISSPATSLLIYNTTAGEFRYYNGSVWTALSGGGGGGTTTNALSIAAELHSGGSTTFDGSAARSIAIQAASVTGAMIASSAALAGSPTTTTQTAGDNSTKISTTAFVTTAISNAVAGINPAVAVEAATTVNVSGYTYSNGVSGVGATLTQNSAAVVVIDGYTLLLNDRVLFKNQTTGANNGVYVITTLGTGVIPAVFTRASDYNQPSDINNTGAIPVINGTANATTSWLLTSTVTTIGTDSLTYTQFSYAPSDIVTLTGTQTLTNKTLTSSTNILGGVVLTLGSDANYDTYYRNSSGILTRLANGTTGQFLGANTAAAPTWQTPSGTGTVTSVGVGSTGSTLTITSSPVTTSGTINAELNLTHSNSWTAAQTSLKTGATANTVYDGWIATNTTTASSGNQMYSPFYYSIGQGWKTTATAASQAVSWRWGTVPVQGTTNPSSLLKFQSAINGGSQTDVMEISSDGNLSLGKGTTNSSVTLNNVGDAAHATLQQIGGSEFDISTINTSGQTGTSVNLNVDGELELSSWDRTAGGSSRIVFYIDNSEKARIDNSGNLVITGKLTGLVESVGMQDANSSIAAQTYTLELYASYGYTIETLHIISGAGTCTANLKINSTSVTSLSAVSVSSTISNTNSSGAKTVVAGDKITLVITSPSGLNNLQASIKTIRT